MAVVSNISFTDKADLNIQSSDGFCVNTDQNVADTYGNWALVDARNAKLVIMSIKNTDAVADDLNYKIQISYTDFNEVSGLVDGDFVDEVTETTLVQGAATVYYKFFPKDIDGFTAIRLQLKNTVGAAIATATTLTRVVYE